MLLKAEVSSANLVRQLGHWTTIGRLASDFGEDGRCGSATVVPSDIGRARLPAVEENLFPGVAVPGWIRPLVRTFCSAMIDSDKMKAFSEGTGTGQHHTREPIPCRPLLYRNTVL